MSKTIYLHIGTHKTGTTSVQNFSVEVRDALMRMGILYPMGMRPVLQHMLPGHHLLPWELFGHPIRKNYYVKHATHFENLWDDLIREIDASPCPVVVLSSEEFDRLSEDEVYALQSRLSAYRVEIVAYLRRKDTYFESMYQTDVLHHKERRDIDQYIEALPIPKAYVGFVDRWKRVFGETHVHVKAFCRNSLKSGNVIVDFYHQIGFDVVSLYEDYMQTPKAKSFANANVTLPLQYIQAYLSLERMGASEASLDLVRKLAHRMRHEETPPYHFLSYERRRILIDETMAEFNALGLEIDEVACFSLREEGSKVIEQGGDSGLEYLLSDMIGLIDSMRKKQRR